MHFIYFRILGQLGLASVKGASVTTCWLSVSNQQPSDHKPGSHLSMAIQNSMLFKIINKKN